MWLEEYKKKDKKEKKKLKFQKKLLEDELKRLNKLLAASTLNLVINNKYIDAAKTDLLSVMHTSKNKTVKKMLQGVIQNLNSAFREQLIWQHFQTQFDQVHGDFLIRLCEQFPELTAQDQKLCAYLRINLSSREIAQLMNISVRGVEVARYRLRKRLHLTTKQNLGNFIQDF